MKFLKKFAYMLTLTGLVFGLGACSNDDVDYEPAAPVEGAQVYFSNEASTSINATTETTSFEVVVMRGNADEAITVPIKANISAKNVDEEAEPIDYASLFTIPQNVSFGAGKETTKISVGIDRENLEDGQTYNITLSLNDASVITPYGNSSITYTLVVPEPMVLLGTGYWTDDVVGPLFGLNTTTYPVEVYENLKTPGYIYLKDLYTNAFKQTLIDEFGIAEESIPTWETSYFAIKVEDPTAVEIPAQYIGLDIGYGEMGIWSLSTGTLENGIISFPAKGLAVQDNDGAYYANNSGATTLYMPGTPMTDFSLELAYGGFRVAENDETVYPIARAAYGEDVAEIQYAFVAGDITKDAEALEAALNGIEDGSVVSNKVAVTIAGEDEETGEPILEMNLESVEGVEPGVFTVIAIPYSADGEAQYGDLAFTSFYVQGVGETEVADVDFAVYAMSVEDLETTTEQTGLAAYYAQYGYNSTNTVGVLFEGTEIESIKMCPIPTAEVGEVIAEFGKIEDYIVALDAYYEANGSDLDMDLQYIQADGWDYTLFINLDSETAYTVFALVENVYGKVTLFHSTHTTDAADASANMGGAKLRPVELDGAKFYRNYTSVDTIPYIKMN